MATSTPSPDCGAVESGDQRMATEVGVLLRDGILAQSGEGQEGRCDVNRGCQSLGRSPTGEVRMLDEHRDMGVLVVGEVPLLAKAMRTGHLSMVRCHDDDRAVGLTGRFECVEHDLDVAVDIA